MLFASIRVRFRREDEPRSDGGRSRASCTSSWLRCNVVRSPAFERLFLLCRLYDGYKPTCARSVAPLGLLEDAGGQRSVPGYQLSLSTLYCG